MITIKERKMMKILTVQDLQKQLGDYDRIKGNIICRLSKKHIKEPLYLQEFSNLKLRYDIFMKEDIAEILSIPISQEVFDLWDVDPKEFHENALKNTEQYLPANVMMVGPHFASIENVEDIKKIEPASAERMYILSNQRNIYGATSLLYPGVLKDLGNAFQSDLYILPSSLHEVMILPKNRTYMDMYYLQDMVKAVNATIDLKDLLSSDVFWYDKGENVLICETNLSAKRESMRTKEERISAKEQFKQQAGISYGNMRKEQSLERGE